MSATTCLAGCDAGLRLRVGGVGVWCLVLPSGHEMRASTFWSFLLLFVAVFLPGMLAVLTAAGRLTTEPAPSLPLVVTLLGVVAVGVAGLANLQIARQTARNLGAVSQALQQASQGEVSSRIPHSERSHVEPVAAAVDQLQDYLRKHFAEVQSSRDQLSLVLNSMVEGVLVVDVQQRVVLLNESAYRLFQLPQGAQGRLLFELVRNPQLLLWVAQVLDNRQTVGGEVELLSSPPRVLNLRVLALPEGGSRGAVMVVATDISQLRKLERVRQEFVANASHELKTPLASIKACVETLLDGGAIDDPEFRDRFLGMAAEQADRLDKLVRDLLSLTRIESEGRRDVEAVAIDRLVAECMGRQAQNAQKREIGLVSEPPAGVVQPLADEESLEHVLENLIDNAIKYTNAGGVVTVRWREEGGAFVLEVEDTGIGIPPQHLPRIFERFYRVDKARSREVGGTGLGLAIVKHLVQSQGGEVSVTSRVGKGTQFRVRLALATQPVQA